MLETMSKQNAGRLVWQWETHRKMQALLQLAYALMLHVHFAFSPPPQIGYLHRVSTMDVLLQWCQCWMFHLRSPWNTPLAHTGNPNLLMSHQMDLFIFLSMELKTFILKTLPSSVLFNIIHTLTILVLLCLLDWTKYCKIYSAFKSLLFIECCGLLKIYVFKILM